MIVKFSQMVQKKSCICVCVCVCVHMWKWGKRQIGHEMGEVYMKVPCTILTFLQFSKFKLHQSKNYQKRIPVES